MALAAILLIGTPLFAQEMSPIVIETGQPTPSVVRSGEYFRVTYRAKFYDQVLIVEEQMQPENIVAEPFEVVKLEILPLPDHGDDNTGVIHIRDFVYTFRIIKPEKGDKKIPSFNFIWIVKKAGTTEDGAKEENELKEIPTEEVGVRYAYSPVKPPPLNIRDEINFPSMKWAGAEFRQYGYAIIASSFLLSLVVMVLWVRSGHSKKEKASEKNSGEITAGVVAEVFPSVLPKKARKKFLRELKRLLRSKDLDKPSQELEKRVYALLRELILVELSGTPVKASTSDSPRDLAKRLLDLEAKLKKAMDSKYNVLSCLVGKLKNYYEDMESGQLAHFMEPRSEVQTLINIVEAQASRERFINVLLNSLRVTHV